MTVRQLITNSTTLLSEPVSQMLEKVWSVFEVPPNTIAGFEEFLKDLKAFGFPFD